MINDNIFDLNLPENGPFYIDYTRNGKYLLMGGEKGNISMLDWKEKNLILEDYAMRKNKYDPFSKKQSIILLFVE